MNRDDTNFLFANPSFIGGMAAAIDIGGTLVVYNTSRDEVDADCRALASDWHVVGEDLKTAIDKAKSEKQKAKTAKA